MHMLEHLLLCHLYIYIFLTKSSWDECSIVIGLVSPKEQNTKKILL